jgi:hypothetical protein
MQPSQIEEQEHQRAIQKQLDLKIINKYGIPYGMPMSKEQKEQIRKIEEEQASKSNKWMRKRQKLIDKQIEKDIRKQQKNNPPVQNVPQNGKLLSTSLLKIIR